VVEKGYTTASGHGRALGANAVNDLRIVDRDDEEGGRKSNGFWRDRSVTFSRGNVLELWHSAT
jgi:hypothetical protein